LVDTKDGVPAQLLGVRRDHYGNRASANELAKRGYVVLTFDCFMWGSRNFSFADIPARLKEILGRDE
jgi:dienelactone hydrolase